MKVELAKQMDIAGTLWRLAIGPVDSGGDLVTLECMYTVHPLSAWTIVSDVTTNPEDVGVSIAPAAKRGYTVVSRKKAAAMLRELMIKHGASPRPDSVIEGVSSMSTLPGVDFPILEEADIEGHRRMNLVEYIMAVETAAALATRGIWRPGDRAGAMVLDAVVTGAPSDPVAESMRTEDMAHVVASQPLAVGALVRKLREALLLLQDLAKAAYAARGEIDHLVSPKTRTGEYATRLDMFDRWMVALAERCAAFPIIQVPDLGPTKGPP